MCITASPFYASCLILWKCIEWVVSKWKKVSGSWFRINWIRINCTSWKITHPKVNEAAKEKKKCGGVYYNPVGSTLLHRPKVNPTLAESEHELETSETILKLQFCNWNKGRAND